MLTKENSPIYGLPSENLMMEGLFNLYEEYHLIQAGNSKMSESDQKFIIEEYDRIKLADEKIDRILNE